MKLRPTHRTRITTQPVDSGVVIHVVALRMDLTALSG